MSRGWAICVVFGGKQTNLMLCVSHNDSTRSLIWDAKLSPIKANGYENSIIIPKKENKIIFSTQIVALGNFGPPKNSGTKLPRPRKRVLT
ncbi:unnamed protein product [Macrosiphum euphorbiae]|uniref:Uncharacterized protein n=1 Tax=Macrosiphum euphorbiae TaxID=13131 RepID=A0AAV0VK28_9HEMI|nr:unnamed protein product [Macrosiphum euphorbiae]